MQIGTFGVRNFEYDGLFLSLHGGEASYRADFLGWTEDPGIGRFQCSDGKIRLIPSICLMGLGYRLLPPQPPLERLNMGIVHIGIPSRS
jgi:hypothetical protein